MYGTVTLASALLDSEALVRSLSPLSLASFLSNFRLLQWNSRGERVPAAARSIHSIFAPQEPKSWHQLISPICHTNVTIMCRNDELSWLFTNRLSATR